jgi:hypothetical protein
MLRVRLPPSALAPGSGTGTGERLHADVAQQVEHDIPIVGVAGSKPVVRSMRL